MMQYLMPQRKDVPMRTTVTIDDDLWAKAVEYSGITERSALITEAFKVLIEREKRRRSRLLGIEPDVVVQRRGD
jgi:Arc/MetJ family transcription regulator